MTIRLENITKTYPGSKKKVLDSLTLDFKNDKVVYIKGPSGSGKTSLLNIIAMFDRAYKGAYFLGKRSLDSYKNWEKDVLRAKYFSHIFQEYELLENSTVFDNLMIPLSADKVKSGEAFERIMDILKLMRLEGFEDKKAKALSGGQRQRIAVARGLLGQRRFITADEPISSLDDESKEIILEALRTYTYQEENRKLFIASHDHMVEDFFPEARLVELTL